MKDEDANVPLAWILVVSGILVPVIWWANLNAIVTGALMLGIGAFSLGKASK